MLIEFKFNRRKTDICEINRKTGRSCCKISALPISTVPLLEIHGRIIMNMSTIAHEVGVECGMVGAKHIHAAQASGIAQSAVDLKENCLMPIVYEKDEKRKV